ncbi:MAG TPA: hypothetical protein EYQ54_03835 [Myxococcales bacterium]|nr:hypothetical protein [Myxococcales bacterium]
MHHLTDFSLRRQRLTLTILLGISIFLAFGIPKVKPAFGFRVLVGDDHPAIRTLDSMIEEFSGGLPVQIAWQCGPGHPCESVFDAISLAMADTVTRQLSLTERIRDVQGPTNAPLLLPAEGGFRVRHFFENGKLAEDSETLILHALRDPLWTGNLITEDGLIGVIVLQPSDNRASTDRRVMDAITQALAPFEARGFTYHLAGEAPRIAAGEGLSKSTSRLIPVLVSLIFVVLFFLTRSFPHSLITMATMGLALAWTLGALGWLGWPQDGMLEVLAPLIMVVGVCDAIHLLGRYAERTRSFLTSASAQTAMREAVTEVGPACLITTLTTAGAFLSFTTSTLDTFVRFGFISALGVVICLLLTFTLLPLLTCHFSKSAEELDINLRKWNLFLKAIWQTNERRTGALLATACLSLIFFGFGWLNYLKADQNWLESWGEQSVLTQSIRFFESNLGQSQKLELQISLPPEVRIEDPTTLKTIRSLSNSLAGIEGLGPGTSILSFLERINKFLNDGEDNLHGESASIQANAELFELIALDDPEQLARWVSLNRSKLRISFPASEMSHSERSRLMEKVEEFIDRDFPSGWESSLTGGVALSRDWTRDVQDTQHRSFPVAFIIVFLLASGFFRSWKLGLAAMVPVLLPVVAVLGSMGWLGMSLDVARAMIAAIVIGVGVDDAIHFLSHYKKQREKGIDSRSAVREALLHTGRAIAITSVALALGFFALMMSAWQTIASFGFYVALAIIGALLATFFVLPALILSIESRNQR